MGQLVVRRLNDSAGVFRRMTVVLDGVVVARLRPKGEATLDVTDGKHIIRARMDWTASEQLEIDVIGAEVVAVEVSLPWSAILLAFVAPRRALMARRI